MSEQLCSQLLDEVAELIAARTGLHFPPERRGDLKRGLSAAASEFEFNDIASFLNWISSSALTSKEIDIVASYLTVGETYFFRDKESLEVLRQTILPNLIHARQDDRRLKIWSAGCCTGEEPYTIAILLSELLPDLDRWNITLLATDINHRFLSKASHGVYSDWSFRNTPEQLRTRYFNKRNDGRFEVIAPVKKMVTFARLNLAEGAFPSQDNGTDAMDAIFCRNVLMYLTPHHRQAIGRNFYSSLAESGWLLTSPSDTLQELIPPFEIVHCSGVLLCQKRAPSIEHAFPSTPCSDIQPAPYWTTTAATLTRSDSYRQDAHEEYEHLFTVGTAVAPIIDPVDDDVPASYEQDAYSGIASQLTTALCQDQADEQALILQARSCADQGKLAEALVWCDKAIAQRRTNPFTYHLRATILQELGDLDEALRSLQKSLYLDPNFAIAHFMSAAVTRQLRMFEASEKHFENARLLLATHLPEDILPGSDGMTAGRLTEVIMETMSRKALR